MTSAPTTRTEEVYEKLRTDILRGVLVPGSQLQFAKLKEDYGASMGVLREALMRLSAEGLTVNQAQQGFRVVSLSLTDLADLTKTRCLIEGMLIKESIENGDLGWESQIVAAKHRLDYTKKVDIESHSSVTSEWAKAHHDFHMALLAGAKSNRLLSIVAGLRASAEIYRRWSIPFEVVKRDVEAEHSELMNLALARDAEGAARALTKHLALTSTLIMDGVGSDNAESQEIAAPVKKARKAGVQK